MHHHHESTERQYALRELALELGWSEAAIRTLDRDLGKTGTEMTRREDLKTLGLTQNQLLAEIRTSIITGCLGGRIFCFTQCS